MDVRPTTDFAKEGLFNILNNLIDFEGLEILDLFSGTGSISFEFLSRGASHVTAVELNGKNAGFITKTSEILKTDNLSVIRGNAFLFLDHAKHQWDIIFADPPYQLEGIEEIANTVFSRDIIKPGGYLIIEHGREVNFTKHPNFAQLRTYGKVNFSFLQKDESDE